MEALDKEKSLINYKEAEIAMQTNGGSGSTQVLVLLP